ncbi:acetyltransferase [Glaciihabitans arcticus]|uniref:Acetyltransferase n=1 Tax=Glaciihabitans arcticus TaxID=2668039 RepID=A0A4Q9GYE6_9MICO|nr:acyltransferase family protein [Glaciihabitans arcticus]TBN57803.1 acetyltransferase [Glaciihabitans arcticus]
MTPTKPRSPARPAKTAPPLAAVSSRLPGLDGLRALAVTLVILYHLTPGALEGGYIGVDIFFVISGFLITGLLLREKESTGRISLSDFWRRRARRLLPALVVLLLVCCSAAFFVGGDVLVGLGAQLLGALTFSYNWLALAGGASYFDATTPELFRNLWSLAVEEQFYLLWPIVVLGLVALAKPRWRLAIVGGVAAASALAMGLLHSGVLGATFDATRVYYGTDTHSFGLAIGALLALLNTAWSPRELEWSRASRLWLPTLGSVAILALIALSVLMSADEPISYFGGLALVALLTAVAIAGAVVPGAPLARLLDARPLRWIGERSYGLYLWHWPVFVLVSAAIPGWEREPAGAWLLGGIALVLTVAAATLSYRYVETPIRRGGLRGTVRRWRGALGIRRPAALGASALAVLTIALGGLSAAAVVTAPAAGVAQSQIEAGQEAIGETPTPEPTGPATEPAPAALPGGEQIVAVGDSVMLAATPTVQETFPGILIDAVVSRQMSQAPEIVRGLVKRGKMRPILVLGLGTNGPIDLKTIEEVKSIIGPKVQLVLVNVQAPRGWVPEVNEIVSRYAQQQRTVELANWHDAIQPRLDVLSRDQVHPGGPTGGKIYAGAIRDALQRLAELPPLLGTNDYGLTPRPA